MSNDRNNKQITATPPTTDGFDSFNEQVAGGGDDDGGRDAPVNAIQGIRLKFTNEAKWVTSDGQEMPAGLELIAVDTKRAIVKFVDQELVDGRVLASDEPVADIDKLNKACPREEWGEDFNANPRGPWVFQLVLYLLHFDTMTRYTWPVSTVGGKICIRELADKVQMRRRIQGDRVVAIVTLSDKFMNTRYGGRQRPDLVVKKWVRFGGPQLPLVTATTTPELPKPTPGMTVVADPTLKEELQDEVPFNDAVVIGAAPKVVAATAPQPKSAPTQKPTINKRGVQKVAGGRGR
jgi:hypothetical protein